MSTAYLAEDNDLVLENSVNATGVNNVYHAANIAQQNVAVSRLRTFGWTMRPVGFLLEPGDIVRLIDPLSGIQQFVQIFRTRVRDNMNVEFDAIEFNLSTYGYQTQANEIVRRRAAFDFTVPAPRNAAATWDNANRRVRIAWDQGLNEEASVSQYEVQGRLSSDSSFTVVATTFSAIREAYHVPGAGGTYQYRVVAVTRDGRRSVVSNQASIVVTDIQLSAGVIAAFDIPNILFSETSSGVFSPTTASATINLMVGTTLAPLNPTATAGSALANGQWAIASFSDGTGFVTTRTNNTTNQSVTFTVASFTAPGEITANIIFRSNTGEISSFTRRLAVALAAAGQDSTVAGPAGQRIVELEIFRRNSNVINSTSGSFANFLAGNTDWSLNNPGVVANGDIVYSSTRILTDDGLAPQTSSWTTPGIVARRVDGADSTVAGPSGLNAPRTFSRRVYYTKTIDPTVAPQTTNVTYNFNTSTATGVATTVADDQWQLPPPTADVDGTQRYYQGQLNIIETLNAQGVRTGSGTGSIENISRGFLFDGVVTFTNLNTRLADSATVIDGGRITTGTVSADRLDLSGVLTATDVGSGGSTVIDGGRITTGTIAANRLDLSGVLTAASVGSGGSTVIDGARITTGTIAANRLDLSGVLTASSVSSTGTTAIDGSRITTGTIDARRLNILGTNSGLTAGTDGRIGIATNGVNTVNIATGAVSVSRSAFTAASVSSGTAQTITFPAEGGPVSILFTGTVLTVGGADALFTLQLDSVTQRTYNYYLPQTVAPTQVFPSSGRRR